MKVIPIAVNKIEIEFEDGVRIQIHEVDTGHKIILPKDMRLLPVVAEMTKPIIFNWIYKIVKEER